MTLELDSDTPVHILFVVKGSRYRQYSQFRGPIGAFFDEHPLHTVNLVKITAYFEDENFGMTDDQMLRYCGIKQ